MPKMAKRNLNLLLQAGLKPGLGPHQASHVSLRHDAGAVGIKEHLVNQNGLSVVWVIPGKIL